jgi:VWFA-related protein
MTRSAPLVAATLVAMAGVLAAQQPSQFSAGVDLVEVDVSVSDKNGHPITDLTARDFEVLEDGQPQTIQAIYLATLDRTILKAMPATQGAPEATVGATAVPERRELKQRVFVFLLDMNHLSAGGFTRSRDAIAGFIKDGMTPADLVGVVVGDKMVGNHSIGSDKDALLKALADVKSPNLSRYVEMRTFPRIIDDVEAAKIARNDERTIANATDRACREQPGECSGRGGRAGVEQEVESKGQHIAAETQRDTSLALATLERLTNGLGQLPGPKQVAVFSEGYYTDDTSAWLKSVVGMAARNGVRFSTFDARGIGKNPQQQNFLDAAPVTSSGDLTPLNIDPNADVLTSLALDTGGDRFYNVNNFREPLDKLARETSTYYVLGYRPARAFDGSYRRLEVKLLRPTQGERLLYRRAYVASRGIPAPASAVGTGPGASAPAGTGPDTSAAPEASHSLPVGPPVTSLIVAAGRSGIGAAVTGDDAGPRGRPDSVDLVSTLAKSRMGTGSTAADEANRTALDGWQLYAKGRVEEARDRLATAAAQAPGTTWIQYALGQAEFTLQHFDPAITSFERVRKALPEYEPVYFDLADSYHRLGRSGEALSVLRDAERRWPNDSETHNAAGCILIGRQAYEDAATTFKRAIDAAPADGIGYFNLARAYHFTYLKIARSSSTNATATNMLADRNRRLAIETYKKYLTIGGEYEKDAREALAALDWK